jgi:GNAT superfamily N-acetyltransferase
MLVKLKPKIDIRHAVANDAEAMRRCTEAAYQHYTNRIGKPPAPMLADYSSVATSCNAFVAEIHGKFVGMIVLSAKADEIFLENVAVFPEHQGQGIGGKLIQYAEAEARRRGFHLIKLYTNEAMKENLVLYAHFGYVEIDRRSENGYQRVYMQKNLNNLNTN